MFPTRGREAGFLTSRSDRLCSEWYVFMIAAFLLSAFFLLVQVDLLTLSATDEAYAVRLIQVSIRCTTMLLALLQVGVMSVPRLLRCVPVPVREKIVLALIMFAQLTAVDRYYVAKLCGVPDPVELFPELEHTGDSFVMLHFCIYLVAGHFLPVRWFLLVASDVLAVAMCGTCFFVLGSPEPRSKGVFACFVVLVSFIAMGKRQSEVNERLVFSTVLEEKTLRMQAEFQLSRATPSGNQRKAASSQDKDDNDDAETSCAFTTATGQAFTKLGCGEEPGESLALATVWEIGRREQWLIDQQELAAYPHVCLGSGGNGTVIAGDYHGSPVALKLHTKAGGERPLLDVGNEVRLLRKLRHPNIILFHGACMSLDRNDLVLVLERVNGTPLSQFIAGGPAAPGRRAAVTGVCHALTYLHSRAPPVVHGDLKPGNIIVEGRGDAVQSKLLDFGLARLLTRSARPRGGTYRWLAPGALGPGGALTMRDDVFAFGLVAYFAATGRVAFGSLSYAAAKAQASGGGASGGPFLDWPPEPDSALATQWRPLLDLCVQRRREDRPSMARVHEMFRGLDEAASQGVPGSQPCPPEEAQAEELWKGLALARQLALHRARLKSSGGPPLMARLQRRNACARAAAGAAEPGSPGTVAAPMPDSETGAAAEDPGNPPPPDRALPCRYPGLCPTPHDTIITGVVESLLAWNTPAVPGGCCEFHSSLRVLAGLCEKLYEDKCGQLRLDEEPVFQCPSCRVLMYGEDKDVGNLECHRCGYAGPPGLHTVT